MKKRNVAAGVFVKDGKVFIARRNQTHGNSAMRGLWEFPGGKQEKGETILQCLEREIMEELCVHCTAKRVLMESPYDYDFGAINLVAVEAEFAGEDFTLTVHDAARWVEIVSLGSYAFPPADAPVTRMLVERQLFGTFRDNADAETAAPMAAYMRNMFPFLGIKTPRRKALEKPFLKAASKNGDIDWELVYDCWTQPEREFQYLAEDYLGVKKERLVSADLEHIKRLALTKSWWDTVDSLDLLAGSIALKYPEMSDTLLEWSVDDNFWLRRLAIDHQLLRKEKTDVALLARIIENNLGSDEFFINKAIGWSLRDYSKTNPRWVRDFIAAHKDKMAQLSIREAGKYL
jgi:mutator protein MutT